MKVHLDFVTNSSSTNYCMLGTDNARLVYALASKAGLDIDDQGRYDWLAGGFIEGVCEREGFWFLERNGCVQEVGILLENLIKWSDEGATWAAMKAIVADKMTQLVGRNVDRSQIKLLHGEAGGG